MQVKEWDLQSKLATGKLAPVYFISGDETLLVQEACDRVIAAATAAGYIERSVIHADASYRWTDLLADASAMSLFSSQRLLDVRVAGGKVDREASEVLREYLAQPPEDTVLLIRSERDSKHRKSAWYKAIDKLGITVTIYAVTPAEMPKWLRGRVRDAGLQLRDDALQYLSERVEGNLLAAVQEVQKLKLLDLPAPITLESLMDATEDASNYGVFDVIDAMLAGEQERLVRGLASLQAEGVAVCPLLGALGAQLRSLERGDAGWGAKQELVARFRKRQRGLDLKPAIAGLALLDAQGKGGLLGDVWQSLERLMLNLSGATLPVLGDHERLLRRTYG